LRSPTKEYLQVSKGSIGFGATVMMLVVAAAATAHHGTLINYDR